MLNGRGGVAGHADDAAAIRDDNHRETKILQTEESTPVGLQRRRDVPPGQLHIQTKQQTR